MADVNAESGKPAAFAPIVKNIPKCILFSGLEGSTNTNQVCLRLGEIHLAKSPLLPKSSIFSVLSPVRICKANWCVDKIFGFFKLFFKNAILSASVKLEVIAVYKIILS
jgi:hypothetical protein